MLCYQHKILSLPYIWCKDECSAFEIQQGLEHWQQVWGHMFVQLPQK